MRVIVTCGPSYEPIDRVRRLTNFSTGELGLLLAAALAREGHEVICLKGEGATSRTDAGGAKVILLDEPTAGMSRHETDRAVELIRRISEKRTLVIVEHDMSVVFGLADQISVLVYGEIVASGTPAEIRSSAKVREAYLGEEAH